MGPLGRRRKNFLLLPSGPKVCADANRDRNDGIAVDNEHARQQQQFSISTNHRAFVRVPGDAATEQNVRLIVDSGSKKSYDTADLKRALNLPVFAKEKLMIQAFGDLSPKVRECEVVQIGIKDIDGVELLISAYVVPVICMPISNQVVSGTLEKHPFFFCV